MKYVYLAGPIEDSPDPSTWRLRACKALRDMGLRGIDPFNEGVEKDTQHLAHTDKSITHRDHYHATRCDILLVNFLGCTRVSTGTVMEIAWAYHEHIPVVIVTDRNNKSARLHDHPMIRACTSFVVENLDQAMEMIAITLGSYCE